MNAKKNLHSPKLFLETLGGLYQFSMKLHFMNPRLSPSPLVRGTTGGNELSALLRRNGISIPSFHTSYKKTRRYANTFYRF